MYPKKIHFGDSTEASKRSSGGPAESRGCIGTRCTPLVTSLYTEHLELMGLSYWSVDLSFS